MLKKILVALFVLLIAGANGANPCCFSQGLPGIPPFVREGGEFPRLLPGKTDAERWALLARVQQHLIGMKKESVEKVFGKGVAPETTNILVYQLTTKPPAGRKDIAHLELSIHLEKDLVTSFTVSCLWH